MMPMPNEYRKPGEDFAAFMKDAQAELNSATSNSTYTTVQSVFIVFRRRLSVEQAIGFASVLPAVLRALFVQDWDISEPPGKFERLEKMNAEVRTIRKHHNFSSGNAISSVAKVLWRHVNEEEFSKTIKSISPEALDFWKRA